MSGCHSPAPRALGTSLLAVREERGSFFYRQSLLTPCLVRHPWPSPLPPLGTLVCVPSSGPKQTYRPSSQAWLPAGCPRAWTDMLLSTDRCLWACVCEAAGLTLLNAPDWYLLVQIVPGVSNLLIPLGLTGRRIVWTTQMHCDT